MELSATAYPLTWPVSRPRTVHRARATFGKVVSTTYGSRKAPMTVTAACDRLSEELGRLKGTSGLIVSTNVPTGRDGWPRGSVGEPKDPGAAVYFKWRGRDYCLCCDKWDRVADNIAAIAAEIDANRSRERWGVVSLEEAFSGFAPLPPVKAWWQVLEFTGPPAHPDQVRARYRELARKHHPDVGGSHDRMAELSEAYEEGLACFVRA